MYAYIYIYIYLNCIYNLILLAHPICLCLDDRVICYTGADDVAAGSGEV